MTTLTDRSAAGRRWRWLGLAALTALIVLGLYPLLRYLWVDAKYRSALAAAERRDFATARANFDICLREWPENAEVRFQAARAARRDGDTDSAARLLRESKRLGWVRETIELEEALADVQRRHHLPHVAWLLELVRRGHPDSALILEALTPAALDDLDLEVAGQCLDAWLNCAPADERPRILKGQLLERMRIRNDAMELYREAVRLAPDSADARLKCGWMALELKSTDEAAEHFEWLSQRNPQDSEVRRGLARVRHAQGRLDETRTILDAILAEHPDDAEALGERGQVEMEAGNAQLAEKWLRPAAAGAGGELRILYQWSQCLRALGKDREADEVDKQLRRGEEDQKKLSELRKQLMKNSRDAAIRLKIGQILMRNGLEAEGRRWLESGLAQDFKHAPTHLALADYYESHGDRQRAELHRRLAREGQGSSPPYPTIAAAVSQCIR